jgi:hypothetical protein
MSAWGIGARTVTRRRPVVHAQVATTSGDTVSVPTVPGQVVDEPAAPSIDSLIAWIPGEVIAAYAAIVLALQPEQAEGADPPPVEITSYWWILVGVIFAALLTWLGGWSKADNLDTKAAKELTARVILSGVAFAIWSFVIPGSWWYSIDKIAENQTLVPILAGLVGTAFGLLAEGVVRRAGR